MYIQFYTRQTIKSAKILFNDHSISMPIFLAGNSDQNRAYAMKTYNRCKVHSQCRCDFFDLSKICEHCTDLCIRSYVRWGNGNLTSDVIGPFEFGTYRFLKGSQQDNDLQDKKNEEFSAGIEGNKMILEGLTPLEIFKTNMEKISYTRSYKEMKEIYQDYYKDMNQKNSFERY